ncbi:hypothetical protein H632_c683p0 [Helicosporidium sp. ATCC 50920]|nr:hypothetical protein H632_c683p0 [Helicosporidium sp. ATCC 50920]|eukprot:KDD75442.1 hypothetical protein H632_c683p0 [Helicosporidium sp. ATCC 50920]
MSRPLLAVFMACVLVSEVWGAEVADSCHAADQCCLAYEACVSCCLSPLYSGLRNLRTRLRARGHPETGVWESEFELCRGVCRTTSLSTQHENAYIASRKFCFSEHGRPHTEEVEEKALPAGLGYFPAEAGESCTAACARRPGGPATCSSEALSRANTCDALRHFFACEAGCTAGEKGDAQTPAYVQKGAPKWHWPSLCVLRFPGEQMDCGASDPHVQRLCVCSSAETA